MTVRPRDPPRLKRRALIMSNNTSTSSPNSPSTSDPPTSPPTSVPPTTSSPTNPPTTAAPPDTSSPLPPTSLPPSSSEPPPSTSLPPTTSTPPTTSQPPSSSSRPTPSSTTPTSTPPTTSPPTSTTSPPPVSTITKISVITPDKSGDPSSTIVVTITTTSQSNTLTGTSSSSTNTSSSGAALDPAGSSSNGSLSNNGRIAIAVVVPIVAVALLVGAGIFLWRRRKARKDLEEQRRKEVEDYAYNPNADPTIPGVVGGGAVGGAYEMKEDGTAGYRGWGSTTLASSTGRKASTTMSGGAAGVAYSDGTSPTHGNISDTRSGEPLMTMTDGSHSPEGEILGAMGPSASNNRSADVHRGPSNASSSYSAVARSDGSGEGGIGVAYGSGPPGFYEQYPANGNPYTEGGAMPNHQAPAELGGGQPIIRDVTARRNTRIENPAHYPQQSAGISQNF